MIGTLRYMAPEQLQHNLGELDGAGAFQSATEICKKAQRDLEECEKRERRVVETTRRKPEEPWMQVEDQVR